MKCVFIPTADHGRYVCGVCGHVVSNVTQQPIHRKCGVTNSQLDSGTPHSQRGPGTELKKLLAKIGITATENCSCNARARKMDEMESQQPGWCEANLDEIVGWLREEATKRKLPFIDAAGRLLVRRAIANARRAASS